MLNHMEEGVAWFHISFLLKLSKYLGFAPESKDNASAYFDLRKGHTTPVRPSYQDFLEKDTYEVLLQVYTTPYPELYGLNYAKPQKNKLLDAVLTLYQHHIINFNQLKSYAVLKEVFSA